MVDFWKSNSAEAIHRDLGAAQIKSRQGDKSGRLSSVKLSLMRLMGDDTGSAIRIGLRSLGMSFHVVLCPLNRLRFRSQCM